MPKNFVSDVLIDKTKYAYNSIEKIIKVPLHDFRSRIIVVVLLFLFF